MLRRDIALMMEAASTSETSVNFYQITRPNFSEDNHLRLIVYLGLDQFSIFVFGPFSRGSPEKSLRPLEVPRLTVCDSPLYRQCADENSSASLVEWEDRNRFDFYSRSLSRVVRDESSANDTQMSDVAGIYDR
jgi:hypothetical protein